MLLKSADGQDLGGAYTADSPETAHAGFAAGSAVEVEFSFACPLNPGTYRINVAAFAREGGMEYALHGIQGALRFRVESETDGCTIGPVDFGCRSTVRTV
jgi:lipopolysaccharide transport system ATP-binding protein